MTIASENSSRGRDLRLFRGLANWAIFLDHMVAAFHSPQPASFTRSGRWWQWRRASRPSSSTRCGEARGYLLTQSAVSAARHRNIAAGSLSTAWVDV